MSRILFTTILAVSLFASHAFAQSAFEVATIKPSPPQQPGHTSSHASVNNDSGRLSFANLTLRDLITRAFRVARFQVTGPDWIDASRFDVEASFEPKTPMDRVPAMLQALLAERFHLAVHRETRDMPVFNLTLAQEGAAHRMKALPNNDDNDTNSNSNRTSRKVAARVTMQAFASYLAEHVERPVLNQTGLAGAYEFTLEYGPEDAPPANDAPTFPSLFTALQEQLGLKLTSGRGSAEVIVVDKADRTPTEN